jgi:tetratricopeptide (TPR) repeat protein
MNVSRTQKQYIKGNYRAYSDKALGEALGLDGSAVAKAAKSLGLERSKDDRAHIKANPNPKAPTFDGHSAKPWRRVGEEIRFGLHAFSRGDYVTALGVFLAVLAVYWTTLPPTVTGEDSGELIVAAYTLGIPHPPGYPAWCLLAHPFTWIPIGSIGFRVALSSAVFAAGACGVLSLVTMKLTSNRIAALAAGLILAFSGEFWEQAIIAEVYALNVLFMSLCVLLMILWYESHRAKLLFIFSFVIGLGAANHNTMQLLAPVFLLFVLSVDGQPLKRWKVYAGCTGIAASTLAATYLYLPIRSLANPPVDWGNPETWDNFMAMVRREQFNFLFNEHERSFGLFIEQSKTLLKYISMSFTPVGWFMFPVGLWVLWKRNRHTAGFVAGLSIVLSLVFMVVLNYGSTKQDIWINNVFFIPFFWFTALGMGAALAWPVKNRLSFHEAANLFPVLCISLLFISRHHGDVDKSDYYFAEDYGRNILNQLDENALYIPTADHATFPLLYLQVVDGMRPDVTIGNKYGYIDAELYEGIDEEIKKTFRPRIPTQAQEKYIETWLVDNVDRPIYFTTKQSFRQLEGVSVVNDGLVYRVLKEEQELPDRWAAYTWKTLDPDDTKGEYTAELVLSDYYFAHGRDLLAQGNHEDGIKDFDTSLAITGPTKEGLNNLGSASAEHGAYDAAAGYLEQAVAIDPEYLMPARNLMQVYMALGRHKDSVELGDDLIQLDVADASIVEFSADALNELGLIDQALERYEAVLPENPEDADLWRKMGMIYLEGKNDAFTANRFFAQSLKLDPNQPDLQQLVTQAAQDGPNVPAAPGVPGANVPQIPGLGQGSGQAGIPGLPGGIPGMPNLNIPGVPNQ